MKKILIVIIAALLLFGCAEPELADGYQFGDITHMAERDLLALLGAVHDYCDKTKDLPARKAALTIIRLYYPFVPANGICN